MRVYRFRYLFIAWVALAVLLAGAPGPSSVRGDQSDELLDMVIELLASPDRDMRGLALQQVREELPGEAATKRFVASLPKLPVGAQAALLEALGERGDVAARVAVVDMAEAENESVRAAAVGALAKLGGADDVPLLAKEMAAGPGTVQAVARQSLIRLQGEKVNEAILAAFEKAEPDSQAPLLDVLARRNAREAMPVVLDAAKGDAEAVRIAAIRALRLLAGEEHAAELVEAVKSASEGAERYQAKLALMAVCGRAREKGAKAIIAGLDGADPGAAAALLEALARAGGDEALDAVVNKLDDQHEAVRDAAIRTLAIWGDTAAAEHLMRIAETAEDLRHHVVAVRGLAFLAQPRPDRPAEIDLLVKALELAKRNEEKLLVLGFAGASANPAATAVILSAMDDPDLAEAAGLAAVLIAEQMEEGDRTAVREVLQKVIETTKNDELRQRAQQASEAK